MHGRCAVWSGTLSERSLARERGSQRPPWGQVTFSGLHRCRYATLRNNVLIQFSLVICTQVFLCSRFFITPELTKYLEKQSLPTITVTYRPNFRFWLVKTKKFSMEEQKASLQQSAAWREDLCSFLKIFLLFFSFLTLTHTHNWVIKKSVQSNYLQYLYTVFKKYKIL